MERYSSYKDSGVPWVGEIPVEWGIRQLGRDYEVISGATPSTGDTENWDGDIPWITPADMGSEKYITGGRRNITIKGLGSCGTRMLPINSVIVSNRAPIGLVAITASELCTNQGCKGLVLGGAGNSEFLYYYLSSVKDALDSYGQGTTFKELSRTALMTFPYPVPSVKEQNAIVDYLDSKTASIDNIIQRSRESIRRLCEYRQSLISEAVTKGLNSNVPMKDSGVPWIGEIPDDWHIEKAKYLINISNGSDPKTEGDTPVYGSGASSFRTCGETKEGPTVLLGRLGATLHIPHWIVGRYWNMNTAFDVQSKKDTFVLKYYYYLATCFDYGFYVSQNTLPIMGKTDYETMLIPVPSQSEQERIVAYLDAMSCKIDASIEELGHAIKRLREYRQSIINEAVTGKIKVLGVEE